MTLSRKDWARIFFRTIKIELKKLTKTDVFWIALTSFELLGLWNWKVSLNESFIPTVVNGASSTTALLTAFIGILMTVSYSYLKLSPQEMKERLYWTLGGCSTALIFVGTSYLSFVITVDFSNALKLSLSGLIISIALSATFGQYLVGKILKMTS